jgi:hypothetical protein
MICILCGGCSPTHPLHPTDSLLELVRSRACSGPIVWQAIMEWDQPTVCACRMCFHQLRRVKPRRQDKQPLPLDAAVLQTMVPGTMRQQDSRTRERICAALRTPGNAYSRIFEALGTLLHMEEQETPVAGEETSVVITPVTGEEGKNESGAQHRHIHHHAAGPSPRTRMEVWWKYNLQTECFSHKAIARHVRRSGL